MTSPFFGKRWLMMLVIRFVILYAALMFVSVRFPVFETIESATVAIVNAGLSMSGTEDFSRSVQLRHEGSETRYQLDVRQGAKSQSIVRGYHPHGYISILFVAVVLATPALDRRTRLISLVAGVLLLFLFSAGLFASDLALWQANEELTSKPAAWSLLGLLGGVHRTAGAGLLPILTWLLVAAEIVGSKQVETTP